MSIENQPASATTAEKRTLISNFCSPFSAFCFWRWFIVLLPLGYLWFRLINNLRLEWTTDPQYGYGLLVPFLCLGLLVRRWHGFSHSDQLSTPNPQLSTPKGPWFVVWLCAFLFLLYLPTRLIEAAVPEWRPIQWSLGVITIGLTLCAIYLGLGRGWLKQSAFPICFFFVAIPWPSLIEQPIIQNLTRASAAIVIELLGWLNVPAVAHGNVIEVSTGMVGIDEACSGIRSFQSSLMISLFLGEFYRLGAGRRWLLVPLGFAFSMAFNVCRMSLLTLIAAKKGVPAISEYHDPAGVTIAILCTLTLWGLALSIRDHKTTDHRTSDPLPAITTQLLISKAQWPAATNLSLALLAWVGIVEAGVQLWYRSREAHLKPGPAWTLTFPRDNPTLKDIPIDAKTRYLLRFDEGKQADWTEADGTVWDVSCFSWLPGRVAGYLAKRHTPEICLTATGLKLLSGPKLMMMNVHGVELPIRSYQFQTDAGVIQVFHCRWEAGAGSGAYVTHESDRFNLVRSIWEGRGDKGQKVMEFVVAGMNDPEQSQQALARLLDKLIKVDKLSTNSTAAALRLPPADAPVTALKAQ